MMETKSRKKRSENWDSSDKILLRQLVEDKIGIVENKNVDTNTSRAEKDAWKDITDTFNRMSATARDTAQLQTQWRSVKMKAKAIASIYKKSIKATGGGSPPKSPDADDTCLMGLIPHEFEVDFNIYDDDNSLTGKENLPTGISSRNIYPVPVPVSPTTKRKSEDPLVELIISDTYSVKYLDTEQNTEHVTLPLLMSWDSSSNRNKKQKVNSDDNEYKQKLFEYNIKSREIERAQKQREHEFSMENKRLERTQAKKEQEERLKTIAVQRSHMTKMLEMEIVQKEEIHKAELEKILTSCI